MLCYAFVEIGIHLTLINYKGVQSFRHKKCATYINRNWYKCNIYRHNSYPRKNISIKEEGGGVRVTVQNIEDTVLFVPIWKFGFQVFHHMQQMCLRLQPLLQIRLFILDDQCAPIFNAQIKALDVVNCSLLLTQFWHFKGKTLHDCSYRKYAWWLIILIDLSPTGHTMKKAVPG